MSATSDRYRWLAEHPRPKVNFRDRESIKIYVKWMEARDRAIGVPTWGDPDPYAASSCKACLDEGCPRCAEVDE